MIAAERQRRILELAKTEGAVQTVGLAKDFEVAAETIRRDLDYLARKGHLLRTHGGAMHSSVGLSEAPQLDREARQLDEKISIGKEAANLVLEGETLLLDASSTALQFGMQLPRDMGLKVVTYSLAVAERLAIREDIELVLLGGVYERKGRRFSGLLTEMALRSLRIDRFFFSGGGFHPELGVGEPNPDQARFKRQMHDHAAWSCALLDHTKLGSDTDNYFVKPDEIAALVTDQNARTYVKGAMKKTPFALYFGR